MILKDWTVIQNTNGYGEADFDFYVPENWIFEPVTAAEIKCSREFKGINVEIWEEDTGKPVECEIEITQIDKRNYNIKINKLPLGGLYTVTRKICFKTTDGIDYTYEASSIAHHIGVGDNYIIAGQSNAAGWGKGMIHESPEIGVNVYRCEGKWDMATHPFSGTGHSPFLAFAKIMHKYLQHPIGLIPRAVGGSPIDTWISGGEHLEKLKKEIKEEKISAKAVIWYQGCTDAEKEDENGNPEYFKYFDKFECFVKEIRNTLNNDNIPVFTFQLNKVQDAVNKEIRDIGYSKIREIQRTVPQKINNTYVIPTIDAHIMSDAIHNAKASNIMLGERLANIMLDEIYNKIRSPKIPDIKEAVITDKNEITIKFSNISKTHNSFLEKNSAVRFFI